jgi:hypothetical protein
VSSRLLRSKTLFTGCARVRAYHVPFFMKKTSDRGFSEEYLCRKFLSHKTYIKYDVFEMQIERS